MHNATPIEKVRMIADVSCSDHLSQLGGNARRRRLGRRRSKRGFVKRRGGRIEQHQRLFRQVQQDGTCVYSFSGVALPASSFVTLERTWTCQTRPMIVLMAGNNLVSTASALITVPGSVANGATSKPPIDHFRCTTDHTGVTKVWHTITFPGGVPTSRRAVALHEGPTAEKQDALARLESSDVCYISCTANVTT